MCFAILLLSPFGKGRSPLFEQTWIPVTLGLFVPSLVETSLVVLQKKNKNVKSLQTDRRTDRRPMTSYQKSSLELLAQESLKYLQIAVYNVDSIHTSGIPCVMSIFCIKFKTSWISIILISSQLVNWILKMISSIFKILRSLYVYI